MNRQLKNFCCRYNLKSKGNYLFYGSILSFQFACSYDGSLNCNFFTYMSDEKQKVAKSYLKDLELEYNLSQCMVSSNRLAYKIFDAFTSDEGVNSAVCIADLIAVFFEKNNFLDNRFCPLDGKEMSVEKLIFFGGTYPCYVTEEASNALKILEDPKPDIGSFSKNYGRGILGATVGAILGSTVWFLVSASLGMICGWLTFLIAIFAGIGYDKAKGKPTNLKIFITLTVTLIFFMITLFLIYIVLIKQLLVEKNIDARIFDFLQMMLRQDEEFRNDFIFDNFLSLAFLISGVGFSIFFCQRSK